MPSRLLRLGTIAAIGATILTATASPALAEELPPAADSGPAASSAVAPIIIPDTHSSGTVRAASWDYDVQRWIRNNGYPSATIDTIAFSYNDNGADYLAAQQSGSAIRFTPHFPDTFSGNFTGTVTATDFTGVVYTFELSVGETMRCLGLPLTLTPGQSVRFKISDYYAVAVDKNGTPALPTESSVTAWAQPSLGILTQASTDEWTYTAGSTPGIDNFVLDYRVPTNTGCYLASEITITPTSGADPGPGTPGDGTPTTPANPGVVGPGEETTTGNPAAAAPAPAAASPNAADTKTPAASLAQTGNDAGPALIAALALTLCGAAALVATRLRRRGARR